MYTFCSWKRESPDFQHRCRSDWAPHSEREITCASVFSCLLVPSLYAVVHTAVSHIPHRPLTLPSLLHGQIFLFGWPFCFFPAAELWLFSPHNFTLLWWSGFAVGGNSCVVRQAPLRAHWGRAVMNWWYYSWIQGAELRKRCRHSGWQCQYVVPQHHGPPLCLTLAGVGAKHLVHGVYTSVGLVIQCDRFSFFFFLLFSSTTLWWYILLRSAFLSFWHSWPC